MVEDNWQNPDWYLDPARGQRRKTSTDRFITKHLLQRRWICFSGIVEAVRRQPPEKAAEMVYAELAESIDLGEFDISGRPRVLLLSLDPYLPRHMTKELLEGARLADTRLADRELTRSNPVLIRDYLAHCWISSAMTRRWFERHGYRWPPHFDPERRDQVPASGLEVALADEHTLIQRTGLQGRPSRSWDLIERECRRRHADGKRYSKTVEWADALVEWLRSEHPNAAVPSIKTLKNRLAPLLQELRKSVGGAAPGVTARNTARNKTP